MSLSDDQQAMLQLVLERGQTYDDLAGVLGVGVDEVRSRARAAMTELAGDDPDAEVGLTDYLLGQADPIGRADAIRHLQGDPATLDLARRIQTGLAVIAPDARQPNLPEPRGKRRKAALPDTAAAPTPAAGPAAGPDGQASGGHTGKLIAALAAVAVILVFAVLAIAGVFSGGDSSSSAAAGTDASTTADQENITTVRLRPVGGSGVAGRAVFGLVSNEQLYVDVDVQGLDPNLSDKQSYLVWLMVGDSAGYPIDRLQADPNGGFSGRLAVPTPIAVAVGNQARSVRVSSTSIAGLQSEIDKATKQNVPILPFVGDDLASGDIPLVKNKQANK